MYDHSASEMGQDMVDELGINWSNSVKPTRTNESQVVFYWEGIENKKESDRLGHKFYEQQEYLAIESKDKLSKVVRRATEKDKEAYPNQYKRFRQTQKKIEGFPLNKWPVISRVQMMNLNAIGIFSLEQLMKASDERLEFLGADGRQLRDAAIAYIELGKDSSVVTRQAKEIAELKSFIANLKTQMATMQSQYDVVTRQQPMMQMQPQVIHAPAAPQFDISALKNEILASLKSEINPVKSKGKPGRPKKVKEVLEEEISNETSN